MSAHTVLTQPYGSPAWVEARKRGLGASDIPTIVGVNPYGSEYALASEKRGEALPWEGDAATRWGHLVEPVGLDWYRDRTGLEVIKGETFENDRWPHLYATLDGRVGDRGIEIKYTGKWTEPPDHVRVQMLAQMGIADLAAVDLVRLSAREDPAVTRIERDDELIGELLGLAESWFTRYVVGGEWPPLDGSQAARRWLDRLVGTEERQATAEQAEWLRELQGTRQAIERLQAIDDQLVRDIKASMAGVGVLTGDGFRLTWAATKGRTTTDWKAVAATLQDDQRFTAAVAANTRTGEPGTRFAPTFTEETE